MTLAKNNEGTNKILSDLLTRIGESQQFHSNKLGENLGVVMIY